MDMDDNENFIDYQKMNFSPFATQFSGSIPANAVNQFAAAKFAQNLSTSNGQILVSGADGEVHYLNASTAQASQIPQQALITLPITMPGAKPGDAQQTVQIQVVNPNQIQHHAQLQQNHQNQQLQAAQKFQMGQMQIPIQNFQQGTTVLTVAYAPQDGDILHNHGLPEGMTVVAALQPQDLQLLAQAQAALNSQQQQQQQNSIGSQNNENNNNDKDSSKTTVKQEPPDHHSSQPNSVPTTTSSTGPQQIQWHNTISGQTTVADISEYLSRLPQQELPVQLNQFLKFNADTIKRESQVQNSPLNGSVVINYDYAQLMEQHQQSQQQQQSAETQTPDSNNNNEASSPKGQKADDDGGSGGTGESKGKKKRRYKKKPPKPKRPKPGQVHIATAIDGTILFCCPECHRAYPEKENLEQHLSTHKIERRFICDICGAGLKRKEHLERHKLGHNPDRPYICNVCLKGFKRKEHLNLHVVIHSGEKTEICGECGKGFYRKDHLRKHAKSHALKRQKEMNAQAAALAGHTVKSGKEKGDGSKKKKSSANNGQQNPIPIFSTTTSSSKENHIQSISATNTTIIHIPTGDNTTLPVQIQLPQMLTTDNNS